MESAYTTLASAIIKKQELVIGPLAWTEASKVSGIVIKDHGISIKGDGKKILERLVNQYAALFGPASIEACKDAVRKLIAGVDKNELPRLLL